MRHGACNGLLLSLTRNHFVFTNQALTRDSPEIHGSIRAPWPPGLGALLQIARGPKSHGTQKPEIAGGKGIGLPERSHRHILPGPFPNAGNFAQPFEKGVRVHHSFKVDFTNANRASEGPNRFGSAPRQADVAKLRIRQDLRWRKKVCESTGPAKRLPETAYHPPRQGSRALDGNLLSENRTHRKFETIPAAWHPQPRIGLNAAS